MIDFFERIKDSKVIEEHKRTGKFITESDVYKVTLHVNKKQRMASIYLNTESRYSIFHLHEDSITFTYYIIEDKTVLTDTIQNFDISYITTEEEFFQLSTVRDISEFGTLHDLEKWKEIYSEIFLE